MWDEGTLPTSEIGALEMNLQEIIPRSSTKFISKLNKGLSPDPPLNSPGSDSSATPSFKKEAKKWRA